MLWNVRVVELCEGVKFLCLLVGCKVIINTQNSLKEVLNKGTMKLSRLLLLKKFFSRALSSLFEEKFVFIYGELFAGRKHLFSFWFRSNLISTLCYF